MKNNFIGSRVRVDFLHENGEKYNQAFDVIILGKSESIRGNGDYQVVMAEIKRKEDEVPFYIYDNEIVEVYKREIQ